MKSHIRIYLFSVFLVTGFSSMLVYFLAVSHQVENIDFQLSSDISCNVKEATGVQELFVYMPVSIESVSLLNTLCDDLLIDSQYSKVIMSHAPRSEFKANHLTAEPFHLILSRDYFLRSILPGYESFYIELIKWPKYSVYWVARNQINYEMFEQMRIGLLDDHNSQSGYMEPLRFLKHLKLDNRRLNIGYFHNRDAMLKALLEERVDLIPVALLDYRRFEDSPYHFTLINDQLDVGTWYLHRSVPSQTAYKIGAYLYSYFEQLQE